MTTRTIRKTVTFTQPFHLSGIEGDLPPGTYAVDTDEEQIDSMTMVAWRHVATTISLVRGATTQRHPVDRVDLEARLLRDSGLTVLAADRA